MTAPSDPMPAEPGPLFWLGARALTHVGEFRRYYALLAVWVVVMVAVPRADGPLVDTFAAAPSRGNGAAATTSRAPESAAAAALTRPSAPAAATFFADPLLVAVTGPSTFDAGAGGGSDGGSGPGSAPTFAFQPPPEADPGDDPAPDDASADPAITIPPPPATPLPAPPAELEPLLRVVAPLANTGCSPIGLAGVVVALVGPSVEPVPVAQIVPYLTPLYVACGSFPQTGPRTVCEIDDAYVSQDPSGGLLPPPAVVGLGIDTIAQIEAALGGLSNQADTLRQQLNCRVGGG